MFQASQLGFSRNSSASQLGFSRVSRASQLGSSRISRASFLLGFSRISRASQLGSSRIPRAAQLEDPSWEALEILEDPSRKEALDVTATRFLLLGTQPI